MHRLLKDNHVVLLPTAILFEILRFLSCLLFMDGYKLASKATSELLWKVSVIPLSASFCVKTMFIVLALNIVQETCYTRTLIGVDGSTNVRFKRNATFYTNKEPGMYFLNGEFNVCKT